MVISFGTCIRLIGTYKKNIVLLFSYASCHFFFSVIKSIRSLCTFFTIDAPLMSESIWRVKSSTRLVCIAKIYFEMVYDFLFYTKKIVFFFLNTSKVDSLYNICFFFFSLMLLFNYLSNFAWLRWQKSRARVPYSLNYDNNNTKLLWNLILGLSWGPCWKT